MVSSYPRRRSVTSKMQSARALMTRTSDTAFVGGSLRTARMFRGLTQADLARELEVSREFVRQLEVGVRAPNSLMRAALAEVLKIESSFFGDSIAEVTDE